MIAFKIKFDRFVCLLIFCTLTEIKHEQFIKDAIEDSGIFICREHSIYSLVKNESTRLLEARNDSTVMKY